MSSDATDIVSFYRFVNVADEVQLKAALLGRCKELSLLGTVLIAREGVNGTLAGGRPNLEQLLGWLAAQIGSKAELEGRWTVAATPPFRHLRVRVKKEIVALGRPDIRPADDSGVHVDAAEWNRLLEDPQTLVIDTRNDYEVEVGTFPSAIDPGTASFREFPDYAARLAKTDSDRPIAMFCTGGIRCEKAAALLNELGFDNVKQLRGGILNYLETVPDADNRWRGECFVFDTRVAVDRDRNEGDYVQCHACRRPLGRDDLASPDYREGVSCPKCAGDIAPERAERLEERRRQVQLAAERGDLHIGPRRGTS